MDFCWLISHNQIELTDDNWFNRHVWVVNSPNSEKTWGIPMKKSHDCPITIAKKRQISYKKWPILSWWT